MKLPYISASRLKTVQDCPLAYSLRYDPPNEEAVQVKWAGEHRDNLQAAKLGGNIHDALEESEDLSSKNSSNSMMKHASNRKSISTFTLMGRKCFVVGSTSATLER
jgi:hypothetical protein